MGAEHDLLVRAHPGGSAPMWGSTPHQSAIKSHTAMRAGDVVLFAGNNRFFLKATVGVTWRNPQLARFLWGDREDGQTWELMYSLTELEDIDVAGWRLNQLLDYKPSAAPRSFRLLSAELSLRALDFFGSNQHKPASSTVYVPAEAVLGATDLLRQLIGAPLTTPAGNENTILSVQPPNVIVATGKSPDGQVVPIDWVDNALTALVQNGSLEVSTDKVGYRSAFIGAVLLALPGARVDGSPPVITLEPPSAPHDEDDELPDYGGPLLRPALVAQRGEQGLLRRRLFGSRTEAQCAICGHTYPVRFLWAAHIKKRAICSDDEKRDLSNVAMAACLFGCDALFEEGYIAVDASGMVITAATDPGMHPALSDRLEQLRKRSIAAHHPQSADYFTWHRTNKFRG